jgi:hypothetical protein
LYISIISGEINRMQKKDSTQIKNEFRLRKLRQIRAIAAALLLIVFLAVIYNRPGPFGNLSKNTISAIQVMVIAAFIGFSSSNWRCPACNKYLGQDIKKQVCKKCGTRLI